MILKCTKKIYGNIRFCGILGLGFLSHPTVETPGLEMLSMSLPKEEADFVGALKH